ncbi:IclR family transcriptional regulator C-terminal domain-containing protein [Variovorax sp. OV084]|mgnify:CR=1 FL=1|jgi:IclR family pca regulon transcriptional regulator|uniref:IclR family transcriptional regulator domain-containing protein n=1 Tax=Variovorax TaxID=34072 RepID=UPI0008B58DB9|nr:IclR family transcriptional regulator C-terminal domain-containing protein [Variovorax sp. OV084]SEU04254.1 transcriptional regulator, IclR family [Variovorax sp. OV084]
MVTSKKKAAPSRPVEPAPLLIDELDAYEGDPNFMTSFARGLAVIRAFDESHSRLTVAQASERSGLPRSAARRCLYTLQCLGYVGVDGSSFYLKPRIVTLGHTYLLAVPLTATAQPILDRLAREVQETCTLAVLDGEDILFVGHSSRVPMVSVNIAVGSRLPAYCTANGQVLLGTLPAAELDAYLTDVRLVRLTPSTLTTRKQLLARIQQVREVGYSIVDQEFDEKVRSVAVAIRSGGKVVASMSVAVPSDRVSLREIKSRFLPLLRAAASEFA